MYVKIMLGKLQAQKGRNTTHLQANNPEHETHQFRVRAFRDLQEMQPGKRD